ncbi:hypothetical protein T06_3930 [Trichinella sp. T6]|nr:hypothetical protein T06_3930 [Trichinella sp. T6]
MDGCVSDDCLLKRFNNNHTQSSEHGQKEMSRMNNEENSFLF